MRKIISILLVSACILFLTDCDNILGSDSDSTKSDTIKGTKYIVQTISGQDIVTKEFNRSVYPKEIILRVEQDSIFQGAVKFDSIGTQEIVDYGSTYTDIEFYVNTEDVLEDIDRIHFSDIKLFENKIEGEYAKRGPRIDHFPATFQAKKITK